MPHVGITDFLIWTLSIIAESLIVMALLRRTIGLMPLFAFELFQVAKSLVLAVLLNKGDQAGYFYAYWIGSQISTLIGFWLMLLLGSRLFHWVGRKRLLAISLGFICALSLIVSAAIALSVPGHIGQEALRSMVFLDRLFGTAWALFFVAVCLASLGAGVMWRKMEIRVLSVFALQAVSQLAWDLIAAWGHMPAWYSTLTNGIYLVSTFYLLRAIHSPASERSKISASELSQALNLMH